MAGRDKRAPAEAEEARWKPARRLEELPALGHQRYSLPAAGRVSEATGTCACVGVHTCASAWVGVCRNAHVECVCAHVERHTCVLDACMYTNEVCKFLHVSTQYV